MKQANWAAQPITGLRPVRWEEPLRTQGIAPSLFDVFHYVDFGINCDSSKDEYLTCWFDLAASDLSLDEVKPQVEEYGVRPIHIGKVEGHWQIQFKCPPGLTRGWHDVTLRVGNGPSSNARQIAVDIQPWRSSFRSRASPTGRPGGLAKSTWRSGKP
jgi:hypothetical protein